MGKYLINKKMTNEHGKKINVLLVDGLSEILEFSEKDKGAAEELVTVMNANTDSGWTYELMEIGT